MIFWIFPIVPCHAFCMWHWPIGKNLDSSFIWGHHHLIVSIWISVYQLNTSYSLLRRTDETQQGRNSCLRLQMLASVWTLSCHCPVKLLTQYQPCIIVCYTLPYSQNNRSQVIFRDCTQCFSVLCYHVRWAISSWRMKLRWFLSIPLHIPTAHDFFAPLARTHERLQRKNIVIWSK